MQKRMLCNFPSSEEVNNDIDEETGETFFRKPSQVNVLSMHNLSVPMDDEESEDVSGVNSGNNNTLGLGSKVSCNAKFKKPPKPSILRTSPHHPRNRRNYPQSAPLVESSPPEEEEKFGMEGSEESLPKDMVVDKETGEVFFKKKFEPDDDATPVPRPRRSSSRNHRSRSGTDRGELISQPTLIVRPKSSNDATSKPSTTSNRRSRSHHHSSSTTKDSDDEENQNYMAATSSTRQLSSSSSVSRKRRTSSSSPRISQSDSRSHRSRSRTSFKEVPSKLLRRIFSYMTTADLHSCSKVCYKWKCVTDFQLRPPMCITGRSYYGNYYSFYRIKLGLDQMSTVNEKLYHPVHLQLIQLCNIQIEDIRDKYGHDFRKAVKSIEALTLVQCSFRWKLLIYFLQGVARQLRTLVDTEGSHYTQQGMCVCARYRHQVKKETGRRDFREFKDQLKSLRKLVINRTVITAELPLYLAILAQGARHVEELVVNLGPYETPESANYKFRFSNLLSAFVKEMKAFLTRNKDYIKILRFKWLDENFTGYFSTCMEILDKIRLDHLHTVELHFDTHALKGGKGVSILNDFLDYHYSRRLCYFSMGKLTLSDNGWDSMADSLDELLREQDIVPSRAGLDFQVLLSDQTAGKMTQPQDLLGTEGFQKFTSDIHFHVESPATKSISQMLGRLSWSPKREFPKVKAVAVTFEPGGDVTDNNYDNFDSFSIDLMTSVFPNLTKLKISDRLVEHRQIFTPIIGRRSKINVCTAQLENIDLQLIAKELVHLRVLKLWANMTSVDDHGVTGIDKRDLSILQEDDVNFSWPIFHYDVLPSFSTLSFLEELSLRGLGPTVTDISLKFGFVNLDKLRSLELYGKMSVTSKAKKELRRRLKKNENNPNGTILRIKNCV